VRRLFLAVAANCLVIVGLAVPSTAAATPPVNPKVVIIVGPVAGSTSYYKSDADAAAAEARKYTTNVVKIYTPHATWTKAKAALQGASVVIYMGHGNGWPSPYGPFQPYTKDGLGLNPVDTTTDNSTTKYWGEYYLARDVNLAPNAVVLLHHLCYSAGNSEPGLPEGTLSVGKQRVDNMAAGWLRTGARAVIAEVYGSGMWGGAAWYVRQLFTTHRTVDQIWRANPNFNNHVLRFASTRTAGYTAQMDPDHVNAPPFGRSIVAKLDLRTDDITGARYAATDVDPPTFLVPGAASVSVDGAGLFDDAALTLNGETGLPPASMPFDTRLRLDGQYAPVNGAAVFAVHTLDGARSGFMSAAVLRPRDSAGPNVWTAETGTGAFSPNGDGSQDSAQVSGQLSESASWQVAFTDAEGAVLHTVSGSGATYVAGWNGMVDGAPVPDGTYGFVVTATDGWGNPQGSRTGSLVIDTVAPELGPEPLAGAVPVTFSPNGDGWADSVSLPYSTNEAGSIVMAARDEGGALVRSFAATAAAGAGAVSWAGDMNAGGMAPDGPYDVLLAPRDRAGNLGAARSRPVVMYTALRSVTASPLLFFPQDGDAYTRSATLGFALSRQATVNWTVRNAAGTVVATLYADVPLAAGAYAWAWDGRTTAGSFVPRGLYTSFVTATDGTATITQRASVLADAFRLTSSDTTPARGQWLTITAVSAENVASARLRVYQPGRTAYTVTMTKIATRTYRIKIHLASSGSTGTLVLRVTGLDGGGQTNKSYLRLALH
jgi:gliding motility-associated-like protein